MQTWLTLEEFCKLSGKTTKEVLSKCKNKELKCKKSEGIVYIEIESLANAVVPVEELKIIEKNSDIAERTIGMLLTLHEKVLMSKDEIFRLKQLSGDKEFFKDRDFSKEWLKEIKEEIKDDCPA